MPNPRSLKVGDRIRFVSLPEEWKREGHFVHRSSIAFMKRLIERKRSVRVAKIDECGIPWINAVTVQRNRRHFHQWALLEETGWRKVVHRAKRKVKDE